MKNTDPKSLIIGALIAVSCMILTAGDEKPQAVQRYQGFAAQELPYIIDSFTGQVWRDGRAGFWEKK